MIRILGAQREPGRQTRRPSWSSSRPTSTTARAILFVVANFGLGDFAPPPPASSGLEIADFFADNGPKIAWAAGMRFAIFVLLAFLIYGLARYVQGTGRVSGALARLALMGAVWLFAVGTVANTFESILVFEAQDLASQPELARLASLAMNGLFGASIVPHVLVVGTLSAAGWRTRTLPAPLVILGAFQVISGIGGGLALASTFAQGWFFYATFGVSFFAFAAWYLWAAIVLMVQSRRTSQIEHSLALIP